MSHEMQRRGEGVAMAHAQFRDPDFAPQRLAIAHTLVNAPHLPIDLPAFDLTLLTVAVERDAIELVLGKSSPIAKLRLRPANDGQSAVSVSVHEIHPDVRRFDRQLAVMQHRLRAAIGAEKWQQAWSQAQPLRGLPADVPLAFYRQIVPGVSDQGLVRTGFKCNQDCGICWQDRTWGGYGAEQTLIWIEDLHRLGARKLIISGGEPTLDPRLAEYIRHAGHIGFTGVTLETNAIQFSKGDLAERLRNAGLSDCFVSLHSGDAETSDAITRAPRTFQRTVDGIRALLAAGVPVRLNCVMTREGLEHLEGVPDFIHAAFGKHPNLRGLMLSQPSDPFDRALLPQIIPEPERLRSVLPRVIERAFALGIAVSGLDGPCGPPLCAFGADRRITALAPIREEIFGRSYLPACESCRVRRACFGVRVADLELYGAACAQTI